MATVIRVENLSKSYRLGQISGGMLSEDINRWWARLRGLPDPYLKIGQEDYVNRHGEHILALKDVSFTVNPGEVLGIIGRNGAGKSTLLKILSRVTAPTSGTIKVKGRIASLLEVGTGFHPELTGRENIFLNGAILGMDRKEVLRKFDEIVAFSEVEKFIDTPVKRYSSGMYVRLAFAVAAHLESEILIVDEVLAVGDAGFQKKCFEKMDNVSKEEGRTILFVSHNIGAIRGLCKMGVWLDAGKTVSAGPILTVADQYLGSTLKENTLAVDLTSLKRTSDIGKQLRLARIEFNNSQPIYHGEPLSICFEYKTYKQVYGVSFGIGFNTMDGVRLLSIDSDVYDERYDLSGHMSGSAIMNLDEFFLQPGRYLVDVGARSGRNAALDYLPKCMQIEILPGPKTPGQIIRADGGVRLPARWTMHGETTVVVGTPVSGPGAA
ncbi:MAG: ABC transporter ATP-binding protein [Bacteroidetes bacterium]|nr:ABC transporter ATP-binding protein [Bacteroidota bacterium]